MLDWFTTIPGILIICGVILLVIAIILFIVGAKKSKKEEANIPAQTVENNISPVVNDENSVLPVTPVVENTVMPSAETVNADIVGTDIPSVEPIKIEEPVVNAFSEVENSVVNNVVEDETPIINIPDMNVSTEESNTIYGGEVPTIDFTAQEETPVTIYGGNDPLEATQTLPKMEESHTPYGGAYPEVRIVDAPVVPTPVEETVTEMPAVEPVVINEPDVINIPVEEPAASEPVVAFNDADTEETTPVVEEL